MHQFDEHHPELKGFSEYFHEEIFPLLEMRDADRRDALSTAKKQSVWILGVAILLVIVIAIFMRSLAFAGTIFPIIFGSGLAIAVVYAKQLMSISKYTKEKIVGSICNYVGWKFLAKPQVGPNLDLWAELGLLPSGYHSHSQSSGKKVLFEDQISGQAHKADFESLEVLLRKKSGKETHTIFRGQLMTISFPRKFLGRTVVLRDKGWFQSKKKNNMKSVGLVDPVFEDIFEAYGTDQVEARYLLTPVFMQKLVDLESSVDGKNIRFAFDVGKLFIAVETGNRFESGSMFTSLVNPERTQKILNEIGAVYDIVDAVLAPDKA